MIFHDVLLNFEDVILVQSDFTFTIHFIIILYSQRTKNTSVKFSEHKNKTMQNKIKSPFVRLKGSISPWCPDSDANGILKVREHVRDQDSHKHINNQHTHAPGQLVLDDLCKHYHKMQYLCICKIFYFWTSDVYSTSCFSTSRCNFKNKVDFSITFELKRQSDFSTIRSYSTSDPKWL